MCQLTYLVIGGVEIAVTVVGVIRLQRENHRVKRLTTAILASQSYTEGIGDFEGKQLSNRDEYDLRRNEEGKICNTKIERR